MGKRNRTTIRFTDRNYDYVLAIAMKLGLSSSDVVNMIVDYANDIGYARLRQSDSKPTAPNSPTP